MGRYLACGIAIKMVIENERAGEDKDKILKDLGKKVDLDLYEITDKDSNIILTMKKELLEKYAVDCILEQLEYCREKYKKEEKEKVKKIKGLKYDELMKSAKEDHIYSFELFEGSHFSSDISYLLEFSRANIFCDMIYYVIDGKVDFECWYEMFTYFRSCIIKSSTSPLSSSLVIDIIG